MDTFESSDLTTVYKNSLFVALFTAIIGTTVAFSSAVLNVRTAVKGKATIDIISMMTNTVPGMVLGLSYLLFFNNSSLKGTFLIIIICNLVHYFTTPYLMAKNALSKMNPSWETTGALLGDSWLKTIYRVILPNASSTVIEMFSYYFINSMVTISGIIFLVSAKTSLVASKIKELQYFAAIQWDFHFIFVNIRDQPICKIALRLFSKKEIQSCVRGGFEIEKNKRNIATKSHSSNNDVGSM